MSSRAEWIRRSEPVTRVSPGIRLHATRILWQYPLGAARAKAGDHHAPRKGKRVSFSPNCLEPADE